MTAPRRIGPYLVRTLDLGTFRLDGGAMFGSVPKALWSKRAPADDENRIALSTRALWIETAGGDRRILVDAGNGDWGDDKFRQMFAVAHTPPALWGVDPASATDVILTHLHFDHAGGLFRRGAKGLESIAPRAAVRLQRANLANARHPTEKERASYVPEIIAAVESSDLRLADGDVELLPGIRAWVQDGHTRGLQALVIGSGAETIAYPADLIPTASHLHLPWIMGYDRCAESTLEEKKRFLERAVAERWIVVFEHDPEIAAARIRVDERGRFAIAEVVSM